MNIALACLLSSLALTGMCGCNSNGQSSSEGAAHPNSAANLVKASDFDALAGEPWRGTLTYINYSDNKPATIRSNLRVTAKEPGVWSFAIGYDDEPHADGASEVRIEDAGKTIRSGETLERVVLRTQRGDEVEIITEFTGEDNNRPATIRRKYIIGKGTFSILKLVKYEGTPNFFKRHEYLWAR